MFLSLTKKQYDSTTSHQSNALCIKDNEGQIRWVWPLNAKKPLFLHLYKANTFRQKLYTFFVKVIFALKLQRLVFDSVYWPDTIADHSQWALFTGTIGPNRKKVIINESNEHYGSVIIKSSTSEQAINNLNHEAEILQVLQAHRASLDFIAPKLYQCKNGKLVMERLHERKTCQIFDDVHASALQSLNKINSSVVSLDTWSEWSVIGGKLGTINGGLPINLLPLLKNLYDSLHPSYQIHLGMAHGDFTPWNTFLDRDGSLAVIDWELANMHMPLGFDFFHFHLQSGIMLHRKNWNSILADMHNSLTEDVKLKVFNNVDLDINLYLKLYLLYHITYQIALYQAQPKWHVQVYWQIEVWIDALHWAQSNKDVKRNFIHYIFDSLAYKDYALLKNGSSHPADMNESSDIDIILSKKDCIKLYQKLNSCDKVINISLCKKSYMYGLRILLTNDQWVFVDLIWKVKYKSYVFMDATQILQNAYINEYGIKQVSQKDTACYIHNFYNLNNASIPEKYSHDEQLMPYLGDGIDKSYMKSHKENKGLRNIANKLCYISDTMKTIISSKGYTITFSGVDGAGKSTIIDEVSNHIDKVWRKPVVVLRHRPSILPILSSFVHGKEKAEAISVKNLPRTGSNSSIISSSLRWLYYLTDYVVGQVYIRWKYLLRGYVVIYDRYYYDFICDAKRTNIVLHDKILKYGMKLVSKPEINFFLYADPQIILARKKELNSESIQHLTDKYLSCFSQYKNKYKQKLFIPIENIDKAQTMHIIKSTIKNTF